MQYPRVEGEKEAKGDDTGKTNKGRKGEQGVGGQGCRFTYHHSHVMDKRKDKVIRKYPDKRKDMYKSRFTYHYSYVIPLVQWLQSS